MSKPRGYSNTTYTTQSILNDSYDEVTGVLAVLPLEYDPSGATKRPVTGNLALKVTVSGAITYVAEAAIGTAQSAASWRVKKVDTTSGTVVTWCDGNDNFDNVATDLTALSYS